MLPILLKPDLEQTDDRGKAGVAADDARQQIAPEQVHYRRGHAVS